MASASPPPGPTRIADTSIAWRILLTATLPAPIDGEDVQRRLDELYRVQHWGPAPAPVPPDRESDGDGDGAEDGDSEDGGRARMLRRLGEVRGAPAVVGHDGRHLAVSADHAVLDGLATLAVLGALVDGGASSAARGVGERADAGSFAGAAARRLREVVLRPPSRIAADAVHTRSRTTGDVMVSARVEHGGAVTLGTADLVVAAASGVRDHNARLGQTARHVAIAVGVAREQPGELLRDRSALIRITDAKELGREDVVQRLRAGATEPAPSASGALGGRLVALGLRALRRRLGSTLLVSHLGRVEAPGLAHDGAVAFYPVSAGGTGLSLGAATHGDVTVVTLRGRGREWSTSTLTALLTAIVRSLPR